MLGKERPSMLYDRHRKYQLVMIVSQFADVFNWDDQSPWSPWDLNFQVLIDSRDEKTCKRVRRLAQDMANEGFCNVVADRKAKRGFCGNMDGVGSPAGGTRRRGGTETRSC